VVLSNGSCHYRIVKVKIRTMAKEKTAVARYCLINPDWESWVVVLRF